MKRTGPTNPYLQELISQLHRAGVKEKVPLWTRVADDLSMATRQRRAVNVGRISRYSQKDELIVVPGKVLSAGDLDHPVTVAAWQFSASAKEKISKQGTALTISELLKQNPKGKKVRILG